MAEGVNWATLSDSAANWVSLPIVPCFEPSFTEPYCKTVALASQNCSVSQYELEHGH